MSLQQDVQELGNVLAGIYERKRVVRRGTVTRVVREGASGTSGRPMTAFFQIGDSPAEEVNVGNAAQIRVGDEWEILGSGDPADPQWRLGIRLRSTGPTMGADLDADRVSLVIPTYADPADALAQPIGVISEEQLNSLTGPNSAPIARAVVLYRTIEPGSYTVFGGAEHITQIAVFTRPTTSDTFTSQGDLPVFPTRPLHVLLSASLAATGLSVAVALPADVTIGDLISGYHVYWRMKDEIAIGKLTDTGGGSYELQFTNDGRGVDGSTARAHAENVKAELLCGKAVAENLEPGTPYRLYITAKTGYGVPQEKSNEVAFTTWQRRTIPAVASCTVEQRESGALVKWPRPVDPLTLLPLTDPVYRVYRNTSATTSGASTVASDLRDRQVTIQGSNGSGNYYGVQVYDTFGNESTVVWGSDTEAPPYPDPSAVVLAGAPGGIAVHIPQDATAINAQTGADPGYAAQVDPGYKTFVLLYADDDAGTNAVVASRFTALDTVVPRAAYELQGWYKVVAEDFADNRAGSSAPNNYGWATGWQYCASLYPTAHGFPINGNFQEPNNANDFPRYWENFDNDIGGYESGSLSMSYENSGGLSGNYVVKISKAATTGVGSFFTARMFRQSVAVPYSVAGTFRVRFWIKADSGSGAQLPITSLIVTGYTDAQGTGTGTDLTPTAISTPAPSGSWQAHVYEFTGNPSAGLQFFKVVLRVGVAIGTNGAGAILIDDFQSSFTF